MFYKVIMKHERINILSFLYFYFIFFWHFKITIFSFSSLFLLVLNVFSSRHSWLIFSGWYHHLYSNSGWGFIGYHSEGLPISLKIPVSATSHVQCFMYELFSDLIFDYNCKFLILIIKIQNEDLKLDIIWAVKRSK